ncbi:hypothetical protein [Chitinophaga vietnamensis]|uniref:hypothetical protein n=1 Tax=Chitinophaga vietnamensis TaxID=2593957 RepID=UPI001177D60A|nr:hypothetical protein [Chitinophaga vietnamensis]
MKKNMPPVTSTYFVTLVKAYLNGTKTSAEVTQELIPLHDTNTTYRGDITQVILDTARDVNENYYEEIVHTLADAADTAPTRAGMIHQLEALLAGRISKDDFFRWATWHNEPGNDAGEGFFDDIAVDYFCSQLLPQHHSVLTNAHYEQALEIFQSNRHHPLKDKIALVLLTDNEQQRFLFYISDYIQGRTAPEQLDVYLLNRFGMDHHSFPYMPAIAAIMHEPAKLPALLQLAKGIVK